MLELFPFQIEDAAWLAGRRYGLLGSDMGTCKTAIALRAAELVGARSIAVITDASVRPHWPREERQVSRAPRRWQVITRINEKIAPDAEGIVLSYAGLRAPAIRRQLMARSFDVVIADECARAKNPGALCTRSLYGSRCNGVGGLIERAGYVWGLSGRLCPNGWGMEAYPHLRAFDATDLSPTQFLHRFHVLRETDYGLMPIAHRNVAELRGMLQSIYRRRRLEEVLPELPRIHAVTVPIEADREAVRKAETELAPAAVHAAATVGDDEELLRVLERMGGGQTARLAHAVGIAKLPGAVALIRDELELDPTLKQILFAKHRAVLHGLMTGLAKFNPVLIEGATKPKDRQAAIDRFASDPICRCFVAQVVTATGFSLVASSRVTLVEADWSPGTNDQAIARCRRPGQRASSILARFLAIPGSLDEAIAGALARKARMGAEIEELTAA
jgi:SWI/SNF-related matrix-associated actin-dependent regulator of chromatin subfamily A-like protein 1